MGGVLLWVWLVVLPTLVMSMDTVSSERKPFAIVTYCSPNLAGCGMYQHTNKMKDEYCRIQGDCDHLIYNFSQLEGVPPDSSISEITSKPTSVKAMWACVKSILLTIQLQKYEWVLLLGGDQFIVDPSRSLSTVLPAALDSSNKSSSDYFIAIPVQDAKKLVGSGLMSPPFIRGSDPRALEFVQTWWESSRLGNFFLEDQSVMNSLIYDVLREHFGKPKMLESNLAGVHMARSRYDIRGQSWKKQQRYFIQMVNDMIHLYGDRPFSTDSLGRQSPILLYEIFAENGACVFPQEPTQCGFDWNSKVGAVGQGVFIWHMHGLKNPQAFLARSKAALNQFYPGLADGT